MNNKSKMILENDITRCIDGIVLALKKSNIDSKEIAESIKDVHETIRIVMYLTALKNNDKELANKIDIANEIIIKNRINDFKNAVTNGTHKEFLSTISETDKSSLKINMGLVKELKLVYKPYTLEDQKYHDIIEESNEKNNHCPKTLKLN